MIEIDTNILVRHISQDDEQQSPEATTFLANNLCKAKALYAPQTVILLGDKAS